ncbi:DUF4382 domain-containing protein [Xanthovirga aplysinae]|uniref:DUF4382 domain-containing protein n=1 Tax=Xanthovirga aplysinae TaxID=2529853 RepID=UPI0012BCE18B|nr:DUF4382 domain-containing protein [Xanthovirga aplysinae]MTI32325.1 DUF4382 domain-containing protein [Xanthovirga aplysinae]
MRNLNNLTKYTFLAIFSFSILALYSCKNEKEDVESETEVGLSRFQVSLVDSPADYEEVNIDIQDVLINRASDEDDGWESLQNVQPGIYDLLELTAGNEAILTDSEIAAGKINQIRLVLGEENSVKIDGEIIPLSIPSAEESGLKLNLHEELAEGVTYKLLLDFDAALSVIKNGNSGIYTLKPVIRTSTEAESGSIKGIISPAGENAVIYAVKGEEEVISTYPDENGQFIIRGAEPGIYEIRIEIPSEGATDETVITIKDVEVLLGEVTDIGGVELHP